MTHSYQLIWLDYFPNEKKFEFCRNKESIVRNSGQYFIYFSLFNNIVNQVSVQISSQNDDTKVLIHTNIFDNCSSNGNYGTGGCIFISKSGHIIISKNYFKSCSANQAKESGQTFYIKSSKCETSLSSFCQCKGKGDYAGTLYLNSQSKIYYINETNNECHYETAFRIGTESSFKLSIVANNIAIKGRIIYWSSGTHFYSENMIINNSEYSQAIVFNEGLSNVTISKCSFVNNNGKSLFYAYLYQSLTSSMTIEECSMISNEVSETFKSDPGMILNNENAGHLSFQVFVHVLSNFETLPPFQDYIISCRLMHQTHFHFYLLFPLIIL